MPSDISKMSHANESTSRAPACFSAPRKSVAADTQQCRDVLDRVLRQTVISRLCLAHAQCATDCRDTVADDVPVEIDARCIDQFAEILRHGDRQQVDAFGEALVARDFGVESMLLDVIPAAAARLSVIAADACGDQADFLLAHWRLREMVEQLAPRLQAAAPIRRHGRSALIGTCDRAGDRLWLQIAGELLCRDGWDTWSEPEAAADALVRGVRSDWFALVVLASQGYDVDALAGLIHCLRRASCNPDLRVLVVSPGLATRPDRMARLGADAAARDVRQAGVQARRMLALMRGQSDLAADIAGSATSPQMTSPQMASPQMASH